MSDELDVALLFQPHTMRRLVDQTREAAADLANQAIHDARDDIKRIPGWVRAANTKNVSVA